MHTAITTVGNRQATMTTADTCHISIRMITVPDIVSVSEPDTLGAGTSQISISH